MARKNRNLTQTRHGDSPYKLRRVIAEICQHFGGLCKIWEIAEKDGKGMEKPVDERRVQVVSKR